MKRFLVKVAMFFTIQFLLVGWMMSSYRPNPELFWASTVLKHKRLKETPSPRIIFVGGSNVAFGLDSQLIADKLPYAPVNMGLDAGLGLDFILNEVADSLNPGDIVILSLEYELFLGLRGGQASSLARVLEQRPQSFHYVDWVNVTTLLDRGFGFLHWMFVNARRELDKQKISGPYSLSAFNKYGDAEWHLDRPSKPSLLAAMEQFQRTLVDTTTVQVLNQFHTFCKHVGATLYLSHPPLPDYYGAKVASRVPEIEREIYLRVTIPSLDQASEMYFPVGEFYDTEYHLLRKGRELRTLTIVERLNHRHEQGSIATLPNSGNEW